MLKIGIIIIAVVAVVLLLLRIFRVPKATLQPWHNTEILKKPHDFAVNLPIYPDFKKEHYDWFLQNHEDFSEYLEIERQYIKDIYAGVAAEDEDSRYHSEPHVGNFSFELQPKEIIAGALLIHGLSDSPHYISALANIFKEQGCYVIGLRLPGHGSIPAALVNVHREDWNAAVEFGTAMVLRKLERVPGAPKFYVGGFSTGGALTWRYTLKALLGEKSSLTGAAFRKPDKLFLFSPAIAVTAKAIMANWHKAVNWLPGFKKLIWDNLMELEDDHCKYNSFPKNAGDQIHLLTKENRNLVKTLKKTNKHTDMPPIFAFQSTVDSTVKAEALVQLYSEIANAQSELFLFDINRSADILKSVIKKKKKLSHNSYKLNRPCFRFTFLTNQEKGEPQVFAYTWEPCSHVDQSLRTAAAAVPLTAPWPEKVSCLSHVAVPISPGDSLYGQASRCAKLPTDKHSLLGEKKMLDKSTELVRLCYNPFFSYIEEMIRRELGLKNN